MSPSALDQLKRSRAEPRAVVHIIIVSINGAHLEVFVWRRPRVRHIEVNRGDIVFAIVSRNLF